MEPNGSGGQAPGNNTYNDICPRCGCVRTNGVCPNCGKRSGLGTGAKTAIALVCVFLAAIAAAVIVGLKVGSFTGLLDTQQTQQQQQQDDSSQPAQAEQPVRAKTEAADPGFYWGDYWADYLELDPTAIDAADSTICDARRSMANYTIEDYIFRYSGAQQAAKLYSDSDLYFAYPTTTGVQAEYRAHYIQLRGDIPNLDDLNDKIRYYCLNGPAQFIEVNDSTYANMYGDSGNVCGSEIRTYVTYNTADFISIAVLESDTANGATYPYIVSLNIDLKEGKILEMPDMMTIDSSFFIIFNELGNEQFADYAGFQSYTDEQKTAMLDGTESYAAIFLQPDMVQIGYNYDLGDEGMGWLTVEYPADKIPQELRKYYDASANA